MENREEWFSRSSAYVGIMSKDYYGETALGTRAFGGEKAAFFLLEDS